jgi:uncharacterized membrane protein
MTTLPATPTSVAARLLGIAPSICASVLCAPAFALSLLPSLLPRPAIMQGVLSGLLVAVALGVANLLERLERRLVPASSALALRWSMLSVATGLATAALLVGDVWLRQGRGAVGISPPDRLYWPLALAAAALTCALLAAAGRGLRWLLRRSTTRRAVGGVVACALLPLVAGATGGGSWLTSLPYPGVNEPTLSLPSRFGAVRVYVGIDEADSPRERAALAVRRIERRGAFDRAAVVVTFPTGTGWVNMRAVNGFERDLHGDLATVAVQGGTAPSWVELLVNRSAQERSAQALFDAVAQRLAALPQERRPTLHLYGESLGALLGRSVLTRGHAAEQVCSVVWAGVPGGAATQEPGDLTGRPVRERVLGNPDDPVSFWSPSTAVHRPHTWPDRVPWAPGLSYVTTTLDLVGALGTTPGHGHVYGREQPWRLDRSCG